MEKITLMLQNLRGKMEKLKQQAKIWMKETIVKVERKLGLPVRCSMCTERIFCEAYYAKPYNKSKIHPDRCTTAISSR